MLACGDIGVSGPGEISAYRRLGGYRRTGWGDIGVSAPAWGDVGVGGMSAYWRLGGY